MNKSVIRAIVVCTAGILLVSGAQAAEFIPLGDLPGGDFFGTASDVSDDGGVVVGNSNVIDGGDEAFRWISDTGMVGLGDLAGGRFWSGAQAVSANGSVVVGFGFTAVPIIDTMRDRRWD